MNWQEIIKPEKATFKTPTQYPQNTQNEDKGHSFEDFGNTGKVFSGFKSEEAVQEKPFPFLDYQGRFCCKGLLPDGTLLDELIRLGASDQEIENHIGPIHQPTMWKQWQLKKESRTH
jgi:hypothetical protein